MVAWVCIFFEKILKNINYQRFNNENNLKKSLTSNIIKGKN